MADEWYLAQHYLYPIIEKRCHHLWSFVLKWFSSKFLCHNKTKVVPWVKWEKEKFLEASRTWALCPPLSLSLWVSLSSRSPWLGSWSLLTHNSLNYSYPLSLIITSSYPYLSRRTIEVLLCYWIDYLLQIIGEHREKIWSLWGWSVCLVEMLVDTMEMVVSFSIHI